MAYGFDTSASFGRFYPDGEFPGYHDQLNGLFQEMLAKGQAEQKFFNEFRWAHVDNMHGGTDFIAVDLLPKRFVLLKHYQSLADLINLGAGIAVTAQLRDLIEKLEPGRHQFWPVEIIQRSEEAHPSAYFMLRVLSRLDAFDKDKSDPTCWEKSVRILKIAAPKKEHAYGIALSRRVIANQHIWRGFVSPESGISGFDFYVSDTLKAVIDAAGLKMPPFYQLKEV